MIKAMMVVSSTQRFLSESLVLLVGESVYNDGAELGVLIGDTVGLIDGESLGDKVGKTEGDELGEAVGDLVGLIVGFRHESRQMNLQLGSPHV